MKLFIMSIKYCNTCVMADSSQNKGDSKRKTIIRTIVDVVIWLTASSLVFYLFAFGTPYENGFFCDDKSLSYPSIQESISTPVLAVVGFTISFIVVVSIEILNWFENKCNLRCHLRESLKFCLKNYFVFIIGFLIQELFVDAVKNKMGILRPNFFDVCKPQYNASLCPGYISEYTCTGSDDKEIKSSRQSFPSGHSSFSMYIAAYFCIYIDKRLQIRYSKLLKLFLQTVLTLAAVLCGLGRVRDNKHHFYDVVAGFILGFTVAVFVHFKLGDAASRKQHNYVLCASESCGCCNPSEGQSDIDLQNTSQVSQTKYNHHIGKRRNSSSKQLLELQNNNNKTSDIV